MRCQTARIASIPPDPFSGSYKSYNYQFLILSCQQQQQQQETATDWLAAATKQLSLINNNNNNNKSEPVEKINHYEIETVINERKETEPAKKLSSTEKSKDEDSNKPPLIDQRRRSMTVPKRKTSILRSSHSLDSNNAKKDVRFADSLGYDLVKVVYFDRTPPTRRFSSYTPPTYLSEWNTDSWMKPTTTAAVRKFCDNSSSRFELVPVNFTNPSSSLNFSRRLGDQRVLLHSLTTAQTTIYGTVSVMNIHFEKKVFVRYTFDDWKTNIEREASYMIGSHDGNSDKFSFVIYTKENDFDLKNNSNRKTISFAIRFITGDGQEFWDNNSGQNYILDLKPF